MQNYPASSRIFFTLLRTGYRQVRCRHAPSERSFPRQGVQGTSERLSGMETESAFHRLNSDGGQHRSIHEPGLDRPPRAGSDPLSCHNKGRHECKGTVSATVRGTRSENLSAVFDHIPLAKRFRDKKVTIDFSDSMYAAVTSSFPNTENAIDCFQVIQLATSALNKSAWEA